jgi:nucleoside-diphosphate-sugar epimerase
MRVLVLGAGGFVGSRVVATLATAGRFVPVAAMRRPSSFRGSAGIEVRSCDGTDLASVRRALDGVDYVVNCVLGSGPAMVATTRHLCQAAQESSVRRLVHLSSIAVHGKAEGFIDASAEFGSALGSYAKAKVASERLVAAAAVAGLETVILRPGLVYGPGGDQWTRRIGDLLRRGRIGDLGEAGDGKCNLIEIGEVASGVAAALTAPAAAGHVYFLADPNPMTWNTYVKVFGRAIGALPIRRITPLALTLETKLAAPPLKILQIAGRRLGAWAELVPDPFPPSLLRLCGQDVWFDGRSADRDLGFERLATAVGIERAARWYRQARC